MLTSKLYVILSVGIVLVVKVISAWPHIVLATRGDRWPGIIICRIYSLSLEEF